MISAKPQYNKREKLYAGARGEEKSEKHREEIQLLLMISRLK